MKLLAKWHLKRELKRVQKELVLMEKEREKYSDRLEPKAIMYIDATIHDIRNRMQVVHNKLAKLEWE